MGWEKAKWQVKSVKKTLFSTFPSSFQLFFIAQTNCPWVRRMWCSGFNFHKWAKLIQPGKITLIAAQFALWPALNKTPGDEDILFKELKDLHSDTMILVKDFNSKIPEWLLRWENGVCACKRIENLSMLTDWWLACKFTANYWGKTTSFSDITHEHPLKTKKICFVLTNPLFIDWEIANQSWLLLSAFLLH